MRWNTKTEMKNGLSDASQIDKQAYLSHRLESIVKTAEDNKPAKEKWACQVPPNAN